MKKYDVWFEKARRDYEIAYKLLENKDNPYIPEALYHAQQSVEKSLKGFLVFHEIVPDKTHNLMILLAECMLINPKLQSLTQIARHLTDFATKTRYPEDDFMIPYLPAAIKYIDDAKFAFEFIQTVL